MPAIEIRGNSDLRKALRTFTPDLEKALQKELRAALKPVVSKAKSFVPNQAPMSRWAPRAFSEATFPFWNPTVIKNGITYTTKVSKPNRDGFTSMARIINKSAIGAIYETAGRKNPDGQEWVGPGAGGLSKGVSRSVNPQAGKQFISNLPELVSSHKGRGRLIYRAWRDSRGVAEGAAMKAIDKATTEFYARNNSQRFRRAA
jgi:hypothetical protein